MRKHFEGYPLPSTFETALTKAAYCPGELGPDDIQALAARDRSLAQAAITAWRAARGLEKKTAHRVVRVQRATSGRPVRIDSRFRG